MRDRDGNLLAEAIDLLNKAAREAPHEMYPLSQIAADMGRARLLVVKDSNGVDVTGLASRRRWDRPWLLYVADEGWDHVTDPEMRHKHRCKVAFERLGGKVAAE